MCQPILFKVFDDIFSDIFYLPCNYSKVFNYLDVLESFISENNLEEEFFARTKALLYPSERAKCNVNKIMDSYSPKTFVKGLYSPV